MRKSLKGAVVGAIGVVAATMAQAENPDIGVIVPTLDAQFWNSYVEFMKKGADELGVNLVVLNADNKPDQMIKGLEDLVAQGVDGVIYTPYWATAVPGLTLAKNAGIPVILTDSYAEFSPQDELFPNYLAFVGPSDRDAGKQMAEALFAKLSPAADGGKYIAVVNGTAGTSVAIDRRAGLQDALDANPDVVVVGEVDGNFVRDTSQTVFESLWQGNPDIQGVWAANGGTATGVIAAITNAGKTPGEDVIVVGMDLNPENVDAVEKGELLFDIGGHWLQGGFALVMMYDHLNGHEIPADKANVKLELLPLTQDMVAKFRADFPGGVPAYDFRARSKSYNAEAETAVFEMKYSD
ncbi:MAG: ABC transporter substrate-binding protein [Pikeienuella sp.]